MKYLAIFWREYRLAFWDTAYRLRVPMAALVAVYFLLLLLNVVVEP